MKKLIVLLLGSLMAGAANAEPAAYPGWAYAVPTAENETTAPRDDGTVFSLPGLLLYFILRPPKTLAELYEESLAEEAMLQDIHVQSACPACK